MDMPVRPSQSMFGAPGVGFVRLNAGTIPAVLDEAVARIAIALG